MKSYIWVAAGSALGGILRYALTQMTLPWDTAMPWGTILVNVLGSFVIGFVGTLTLAGGRYAASPGLRLFIMIGICGGFTTFSSFSLQTLDLLREGALWRAALNITLSVALSLTAVLLGHRLAQFRNPSAAIAETGPEEFGG